jgi:hypothetical protein
MQTRCRVFVTPRAAHLYQLLHLSAGVLLWEGVVNVARLDESDGVAFMLPAQEPDQRARNVIPLQPMAFQQASLRDWLNAGVTSAAVAAP